MTKRVLLIGTTMGLVSGEKLDQEKAIYVTLESFQQSGYETILLTENREVFPDFHTLAQHVIFQDINLTNLKSIIIQYQIDFIFPTYAANNKLNIFKNLIKQGFLEKNHVKLLVLNQKNLNLMISHKALTNYLQNKGFRLIEHEIINKFDEAMAFVQQHHFPIIIRVNNKEQKTYWNSINTKEELIHLFQTTKASEGYEVERSINTFKEITMTTVRDRFDNKALIYASEDIDPIGIHSNDSISVTPVYSITNRLFQRIRDAVLKLTRLLKIVGICTFHLAVDEKTDSFYVLEISPLFQSKILPIIASTGYPLFEVICQISLGCRLQNVLTLDGSIINAAVELTPNHLTGRFPIWQSPQLVDLNNNLGPHKSSLGAVIVNGNNLETVIMKGFKILNLSDDIFINHPDAKLSDEQIESLLFHTSIRRIIAVCEALNRGFDVQEIQSFTKYNLVFLETLKHLLDLARLLEYKKGDLDTLLLSKRYGFTDFLIAKLWNLTTAQVTKITSQLSLNRLFLPTPSSYSLDHGAVLNYYSSFLDDPFIKEPNYQIIINNYPNSDMISNHEMTILAHQLIHRFQSDGYSVAAQGNLLSKIDSHALGDFYVDSSYNKSYLFSPQNRLNIAINTIENQHINYPVSIYNLKYQQQLLQNHQITTEIIFIQDNQQRLWLSLPITNVLKKLSSQHFEMTAIPSKLKTGLVKRISDYVHSNYQNTKFGTIIISDNDQWQWLDGFTINVGIVSQVNPNFIDVLCHCLVGIATPKSQKSKHLFGRKINLKQLANGLYTTKVKYFDLPTTYRQELK
ncbi:ATP-binding protein [Bombilactobacillus bombi]|uniref:ATP-binding protein n=1 Tax=Bombilactobacillus bombi TaxID=1303590 RepID=UPI0015E5E86D|nr:hypothetical protein [Bombilactobacillus bombi]MBA1434925.1 hypothetical protein [Bombilactobacillus bombi]